MTLAANHTLRKGVLPYILYVYGGYLLEAAHLPQIDHQCGDVSSVSHKYLQDFGKIAVCVSYRASKTKINVLQFHWATMPKQDIRV